MEYYAILNDTKGCSFKYYYDEFNEVSYRIDNKNNYRQNAYWDIDIFFEDLSTYNITYIDNDYIDTILESTNECIEDETIRENVYKKLKLYYQKSIKKYGGKTND